MAKVILISCSSKKLHHKSKVKDLYNSPLFKKSLDYSTLLKPDYVYILSAKYGLLNLDQEIKPYNETLNQMSKAQIKIWAEKVIASLNENHNLNADIFIILAGFNYYRYLISKLKNYTLPLSNKKLGHRLSWLNNEIMRLRKNEQN